MRALALILICTFATARPLTRQDIKWMSRLQKRCDDAGEGQACFDYAQALKLVPSADANSKSKSKPSRKAVRHERAIARYTRRACQLAYAPACNEKSKTEPARLINNDGRKQAGGRCGPEPMSTVTLSPIRLSDGGNGQQITRIQKDSLLAKAGLRLGDVVTSVNGAGLTSPSQIVQALDAGGAMIEVQRGAAIIPLAISCP